MPTFPNLVGVTPAAAADLYSGAGFTGNGYASYAGGRTGLVIAQIPAAGTTQDAATDANLTVAAPSGNTVVWGT